jgi:transcriptional regulator
MKLELPEEDRQEMLAAIVGFEIPIDRLEGKLKLSQNREPSDRHRVREALGRAPTDAERGVARLMSLTS